MCHESCDPSFICLGCHGCFYFGCVSALENDSLSELAIFSKQTGFKGPTFRPVFTSSFLIALEQPVMIDYP